MFLDVETTGLHTRDRVVSLGCVLWHTEAAGDAQLSFHCKHLVFDPGLRSHPEAERVHGFDDWFLRHQPPFEDHVDGIAEMIAEADLVVAHNVEFDWEFLRREFAGCGRALPEKRLACTMQEFRALGLSRRASLSAATKYFGLTREGAAHGALEDAWLCMMIYLRLNTPILPMPFSVLPNREIQNLREVPSRPDGRLPRRKSRKRKCANQGAA